MLNRFPVHDVDARVGRRLAQRRTERAMPVEAVAEYLAIGTDEVADFEQGSLRPTPEQIIDLASFLEVGPGWFFAEDAYDGSVSTSVLSGNVEAAARVSMSVSGSPVQHNAERRGGGMTRREQPISHRLR